MKSTIQFAAIFWLMAAMTSCFSPRAVVRMEAEGDNIKWNYGRQVVYQKIGGTEARISFEDFSKENLIFNVEFVHRGEGDILIDPAKFYLTGADEAVEYPAIDPEKKLLDLRVKDSRNEARAKNLAVAAGAVAVAAVVAAATSDHDHKDDDHHHHDSDVNVVNVNYFGGAPVPFNPMQMTQHEFWRDVAFRKTTLESGYKVEGKVVFPRSDFFKTFIVAMPVEDKTFKVVFNQYIIKP